MNQEEMKTELARAIELRDMSQAALDAHIVRIARLELDLAEAEKPGLRHLDFGGNKYQRWIKLGKTIHWIHGGRLNDTSVLADTDFIEERKGNLEDIFDDLEVLSKPLTYFKADVHEYKIDFVDHAHAPVEVAGNWHTLAEAKQISQDLQRLVRTAEMGATK